jgi:hypothetical protein
MDQKMYPRFRISRKCRAVAAECRLHSIIVMSERADALLARAAEIDQAPPESRRREHLVERATAVGHTREYADLIYDVASEEGVTPAVAFEVVLSGVGVRELTGSPSDSWQETQVEAPPAWVSDPTPGPDAAARERRIRASLRRLRQMTEQTASTEEALRAFVREVDVGDVDY